MLSGPRVTIRLKMLLVISGVLLMAIGAYLYLATTLFTRDKLAYIYDLNAALVSTASEQSQSNLEVLRETLAVTVRDLMNPNLRGPKKAVVQDLIKRKPDILRLEVFARSKGARKLTSVFVYFNKDGLEEVLLTESDFDHVRKESPVPLEAVAADPKDVHLQNSSAPPEAAMLTMAFALPITEGGVVVVVTDFRHERLLRLFGGSKLHLTYLVDEQGVVLAHPDGKKVIEHADLSELPLVKAALTERVAQGVKEFVRGDGAEILGAFAKVGMGRLAVLIEIPREEALRANHELIRRSALFAVGIIIVALMVSIVFSRLLAAPIHRLSAATEVVGRGELDIDVDVRSRDEIGDLARSFNQMANALKQAQMQLIQSEKMAAFGQLGAGITHEVKNPMTGIIGFAQMGEKAAENPDKARKFFKIIEEQGKRCHEILVNFLKFARSSEREMTRLDVNEVVRDAVRIFGHQLGMHSVRVSTELGESLPSIMGNAGEIQQVLLNLAMNAQQAMGDGGKVILTTRRNGQDNVIIEVEDNGPGMTEEVRRRIFEPFFTTKEAGQGTGLGLAISFGIIRDHKGVISVDSEVGKGTKFVISLPVAESVSQTHIQEASSAAGS